MKSVRVAAAVIRDKDKIFATARGYGEFKGGWEFPGGKLELGETPQEALKREIMEELETEITVGRKIDTVEYDYPGFHLSMDCFWCRVEKGDLVLKEAEAAKWLSGEELDSVAWLPADVALIDKIREELADPIENEKDRAHLRRPALCLADLDAYIQRHYVENAESGNCLSAVRPESEPGSELCLHMDEDDSLQSGITYLKTALCSVMGNRLDEPCLDFEEHHEGKLKERMRHMTDTYSEYLLYLIREKKMENAEVWKRAVVDKKVFSKIKNNADYHPNKMTALCLCVGAKLNLDETKDLLARAGYALSPCDKTDIIFSYFIENEIYDMIELDIQLEEHGLPCIIT